jgi:N-acetylneuraminate synthase
VTGELTSAVEARPRRARLGSRQVGDGEPVFVVAEIGLNHTGSADVACRLVDAAVAAGCDSVKFQKRTPEICVPRSQWGRVVETPWGPMSYIDYRHRIELSRRDYVAIDRHCRSRAIMWTASCWDEAAVDFLLDFEPPFLKAASASLTDHGLLLAMARTGLPLVVSTGMSTLEEITSAIDLLADSEVLVAHSTSTYPCPPAELNLRMITELRRRYPDRPVGYSGHEDGQAPTLAAVALGASFVERHITLDRSGWGSDQRASLEPPALAELVRGIREIEWALGDGVKCVYDSEEAARSRLRRVDAAPMQPPAVDEFATARIESQGVRRLA